MWGACNCAKHGDSAPWAGLFVIISVLILQVRKLRLPELCKSLATWQRYQATKLGLEWACVIPECKPFTTLLFC